MKERVAERFRWAVDTLDVAPSDQLLEVGCGHGVAVSLICPRLSSGTIVAIDRSQAMIAHAARRNRECVDQGRAAFEAVALGAADLNDRFDKVFAINVALFRGDAGDEAEALKRLLAPEGAVYLFQQHPSASRSRAVTDALTASLLGNGFSLRHTTSRGQGASLMTCIVAESLRNAS